MDRTNERSSWKFQYSIMDLLAASQARLAHHKARLESWTAQRAESLGRLRDAGFEVRDYTQMENFSSTSAHTGVQVVVDRALQDRVADCSRKVNEHDGKVREFERWVAVLASQPGTKVYDVTMDDALFFGVAKNEAEQ